MHQCLSLRACEVIIIYLKSSMLSCRYRSTEVLSGRLAASSLRKLIFRNYPALSLYEVFGCYLLICALKLHSNENGVQIKHIGAHHLFLSPYLVTDILLEH